MSHICTGGTPHRVRPRPAAARTSSTPTRSTWSTWSEGSSPEPGCPLCPPGLRVVDRSRCDAAFRRLALAAGGSELGGSEEFELSIDAAAATRRSPGQPVDQLAPRVDQLVLDLLPVGVQPDRVGVVAQLLALRLDQRVLIGQQPLLAGQQ